jgi:hypothetical protein
MAGAPASAFLAELRRRIAGLGGADAHTLGARLTLACFLLAPIGSADLRAAVLVLALAGLLAPPLSEWSPFWLVLAALAALRVVYDWPLSDNHAYLLACWCLALGLGFAGGPARAELADTARLLIGCAFALAVVQKVFLSPDFMDGTFFRWVLADDRRFEDLGRLLGRQAGELESTRALLRALPGDAIPGDARFFETPALLLAARALTGLTFAFEGLVAIAFLAPPRLVPAAARDASLLGFCAGTYAIAPVAGFGWLLVAMGVVQSTSPLARWLYLAAFALIAFYEEVPWLAVVADVAGR